MEVAAEQRKQAPSTVFCVLETAFWQELISRSTSLVDPACLFKANIRTCATIMWTCAQQKPSCSPYSRFLK